MGFSVQTSTSSGRTGKIHNTKSSTGRFHIKPSKKRSVQILGKIKRRLHSLRQEGCNRRFVNAWQYREGHQWRQRLCQFKPLRLPPWKNFPSKPLLPHLNREARFKINVSRIFQLVRCRHQLSDKAEFASSSDAVRTFTTIPKAGKH